MPAETRETNDKETAVAEIEPVAGAGSALAGALPPWDLLPETQLVRRR